MLDGLIAYDQIGEKPTSAEDAEWVIRKKEKSRLCQQGLCDQSDAVRERKEELAPHVQTGTVTDILAEPAVATYKKTLEALAAKRTVRESRGRPSQKVVDDPEKYVGKRIAKWFPIEDPNTAVLSFTKTLHKKR